MSGILFFIFASCEPLKHTFQDYSQSEIKVIIFSLKKQDTNNSKKQNKTKQKKINTKWDLLQNDLNADTTLLHAHDEKWISRTVLITRMIFIKINK